MKSRERGMVRHLGDRDVAKDGLLMDKLGPVEAASKEGILSNWYRGRVGTLT